MGEEEGKVSESGKGKEGKKTYRILLFVVQKRHSIFNSGHVKLVLVTGVSLSEFRRKTRLVSFEPDVSGFFHLLRKRLHSEVFLLLHLFVLIHAAAGRGAVVGTEGGVGVGSGRGGRGRSGGGGLFFFVVDSVGFGFGRRRLREVGERCKEEKRTKRRRSASVKGRKGGEKPRTTAAPPRRAVLVGNRGRGLRSRLASRGRTAALRTGTGRRRGTAARGASRASVGVLRHGEL